MRVYAKKHKQLVKIQKEMEAQAEQLIGKILVWKIDARYGKKERSFAGRPCVVRQSTVSDDGEIIVLVNTRNSQGNGFLNNNDRFHRIYRGLHSFEPIEDLPEGLTQVETEED